MIQLVPQRKILRAYQPVDFRKGLDSLVALCSGPLAQDPFSGTLFVFRKRSGTALKLRVYDGQGFWLCLKRFSQGHLHWWPQAETPLQALAAQQLSVLLYNGLPEPARFAPAWRKLTPPAAQAARASASAASAGSPRASFHGRKAPGLALAAAALRSSATSYAHALTPFKRQVSIKLSRIAPTIAPCAFL